MDDKAMDNELAALVEHIDRRNIQATDFAHLCAISMGCLIELGCHGNADKALALGSLVKIARHWADMPRVH